MSKETRTGCVLLLSVTAAACQAHGQSTRTNLRFFGPKIVAGSLPDDATVVRVSAGCQISGGITSDGGCVLWGFNGQDQCHLAYDLMDLGETVRDIAFGGEYEEDGDTTRTFSVAIDSHGRVHCRGASNIPAVHPPTEVTNGTVPVSIVDAGFAHVIALADDGTVICWGDADACSTARLHRSGTDDIVDVDAGGEFSMLLASNGTLRFLGSNTHGQLDPPDDLGTRTHPVARISAGGGHCLAMDLDGAVFGWGLDDRGQSTIPDELAVPGAGVVDISAGYRHSAAVLADGRVLCWGGEGPESVPPPDLGSPGRRAVAVSAGLDHTVAILESGEVVAWGIDSQLACEVPHRLGPIDDPAVSCRVGEYNVVAQSASGALDCWGWAVTSVCVTPFPVNEPDYPIVAYELDGYHLVTIFGEGYLAAWGGTVGNGDIPTGLGGPANPVIAIDTDQLRHVAVTESGSVTCWGFNLGDECLTIPDTVDSLKQVRIGDSWTLGLLEDGTVLGWSTTPGVPVHIPDALSDASSGVRFIETAGYRAWALHDDGTVTGWMPHNGNIITLPEGAGTPARPVRSISGCSTGRTAALLADGRLVRDPDQPFDDLERYEGWIESATYGTGGLGLVLRDSHLADLDHDGCIGSGDLAVLIANWGTGRSAPSDLDRNGTTDAVDLGILLSYWSACDH